MIQFLRGQTETHAYLAPVVSRDGSQLLEEGLLVSNDAFTCNDRGEITSIVCVCVCVCVCARVCVCCFAALISRRSVCGTAESATGVL